MASVRELGWAMVGRWPALTPAANGLLKEARRFFGSTVSGLSRPEGCLPRQGALATNRQGHLTVISEQTLTHGATAPRAPASAPRPPRGDQRWRGRDGQVSPALATPFLCSEFRSSSPAGRRFDPESRSPI
jgi:hypothetical protein